MRVRVGLVGTGVIAQVMHLHYLAELADRYEVAALCDLDADSARACAERYGVPAFFTGWHDLVRHPLDAATGDASDLERQVYQGVLLDTLVHELNTVRGLLGEPTRLEYVSLAVDCVTVMLRFGSLPVAIHWVDLPGIARYGMEFALYAPDRRLRLTFHPETGTHVEAPWEIERVLEVSDVGLCLETGHMMLGGGDPVAMLRDLGDRVNHVHLKDARRRVMDGIVTDEAPVTEIWTREAFCELGHGDLDADAVLDGLRRIAFGGWLVVEQDILPHGASQVRAERFARAAQEQQRNRAFLAGRGL